ncbi:hypothetical protein [Streptomyces sp. KL116D]
MSRISERIRRTRPAGPDGFDRRLVALDGPGSVLNPINSRCSRSR